MDRVDEAHTRYLITRDGDEDVSPEAIDLLDAIEDGRAKGDDDGAIGQDVIDSLDEFYGDKS